MIRSLVVGYLLTVSIETPILLLGLARNRPWRDRLLAGFGLTAITYPVVILVIPALLGPAAPRWLYWLLAETFAPLAECVAFKLAFPAVTARETGVIVIANLASFGAGAWGLSRYLGP